MVLMISPEILQGALYIKWQSLTPHTAVLPVYLNVENIIIDYQMR